jgi:hypothetical protein
MIGWLIPYHTGGGPLSATIQHIEKKKLPVDILFMGTSRVKRSVIPSLFDSLTNKNRNPDHISFNLAMPAARIGENLYLLKNFSGTDAGDHLKIVMIEWADTYLPHPDNRQTLRARYWMDMVTCRDYLLNVIGSHGFIGAWEAGHLNYITGAFLHRSLSLAHLAQAWIKPPAPEIHLDETRGYRVSFGHAPPRPKGPQGRRIAYFDSAWIRLQQTQARELMKQKDVNALDQDVKQWNTWLTNMKHKGVHMVLLIMPGQMSVRQVALARLMPREHVLDLSDPDQYADLYDPTLYYDRMHLNDVGGRLLTRHLAEAWNRMSP